MQKDRIKVALVINDFFVGGAQRLISEQVKYFDKDRFDLCLIVLMDNPSRATLYHALPPDLDVIKVSMKHFYGLRDLRRLFKALKKTNPSIVISHLFLSNVLMRVFKPLFGYRLLSVEHNTYVGKRWIHVLADRVLSIFSSKVIMVSTEVAEFTISQQRLDEKKVVIIPNGIDLTPIKEYMARHTKAEIRSKFDVRDSDVLFISVGRLTPQKNQKLLVAAFNDFSKINPDAKLFVIGDGASMSDLRSMCNKNGNIRLTGNVTNMFDYYRAADFMISTSIIEGMSMAYLEAMAFGLPIIATKTGGTLELIDEKINGFIIPTPDVASVVETVTKVRDVSYKDLSHAAIKKAEQFSIEENVRQYEELLLSNSSK